MTCDHTVTQQRNVEHTAEARTITIGCMTCPAEWTETYPPDPKPQPQPKRRPVYSPHRGYDRSLHHGGRP